MTADATTSAPSAIHATIVPMNLPITCMHGKIVSASIPPCKLCMCLCNTSTHHVQEKTPAMLCSAAGSGDRTSDGGDGGTGHGRHSSGGQGQGQGRDPEDLPQPTTIKSFMIDMGMDVLPGGSETQI